MIFRLLRLLECAACAGQFFEILKFRKKKKDSDRVKPLEVKPGGKKKGTRRVLVSEVVRKDKK